MELVATIFTTAATATATAAPAAATAATAATTAAGLGSTALGILKGGASVLSILGGLQAANAKSDEYKAAAAEADAQKITEQAQGLQRTTALKRELLSSVGESDVAYAASGVDISSGVAAEARDYAGKRADQEIMIDQADTEGRISSLDARKKAYKRMARGARIGGLLSAGVGLIGGTGFDFKKEAS